MQAKIVTVFLINLATIGLLYALFVRNMALPLRAKRLLLLGFLVAPAFIAIKGVESVVFATDLFGLVIVFYALKYRHSPDAGITRLRYLLFCFLLLWPLLMTTVVLMSGNDGGTQFNARELQRLAIWTYRNLVLFAIFVIASSVRPTLPQMQNFIAAFVLLNCGMIALAVVNYLSIYNLATYEELLSSFQTFDESSYKTAKTTWGFGYLGMFRGSMGQWYANCALLCVAGYMVLPGVRRLLALAVAGASLALVLISFSRAGLVALAFSVFIYAVLLGFRGWRLMLLALLCGVAVLPLLEVDALQQRFESIFSYAGSKEVNRVDGWNIAFTHFGDSAVDTLIGVGATNRERVFHIIGAYGAHNEYIDAIFRAGIGGTLLLVGFLFSATQTGIKKYWQTSDVKGRALAAIAPALLLSNAVLGVTQDHLYRDYSSFATGPMMYLLYGLVLSMQTRNTRQATAPASRPLAVALNVV